MALLQSGAHEPALPLLTPSSQVSPFATSTAWSPQRGAALHCVVHSPGPYPLAMLAPPLSQVSPEAACNVPSPQNGPGWQLEAQWP